MGLILTTQYASVNKVIIRSVNGLSSTWFQATAWIKTVLLSIGPLVNLSKNNLKKMHLKCSLQNVSHFVPAPMCYKNSAYVMITGRLQGWHSHE